MKLLTKENILKNQVDTIEQFKVLGYLKKQLSTLEFAVYLVDRFTIKVVDKNKEQGYFKYNKQTKLVDFYEKNKNYNQLEWVKLMNNYKNMAEEIILKELIYV